MSTAKKLGLAGLVAAVALFAAALWTWKSRPAERPLEPGWEALTQVVAGDGTAGADDGDVTRARFSDPFGVAVSSEGTIYVADAGDAQRIRRIAPDGTVSTLAGRDQGYADGIGSLGRFSTPSGVALGDGGTLFVADTGNNMIRRVTSDGRVSTLAGGLDPGYRDASGTDARFNGPVGIAVDSHGRVIVADTYNDRIRAVGPDGNVTTIAGSGQPGLVDGMGQDARFDTPCGVAADPDGNIYVADTGNGAVRMISPGGMVTTIQLALAEALVRPIAIAAGPGRQIFVSDDRGRILEVNGDATVRTVAGSRPGFADGPGPKARFRGISGIAVAGPGRLMVTESRNALVRLVAARSRFGLRAPPSPRIAPEFDADGFGEKPLLWPISPMEGPFEITGTLGEARGGEGSERFHAGIDVHAGEGTVVRVVRSATVSSPIAAAEFGNLNESIRIGPVAYVHLRVGRTRTGEILDSTRFVASYDDTGSLARVRVRRGTRFATGEAIGSANPFNHVHLNVGWPGEEYNPLRFRLVQFEDTVPPTIARKGIHLFAENGLPFTERKKGRLVISGRVQVVVDAWDQANGNETRRRLGLYRLGYQVLKRDGTPAPGFESLRETIRFDRLAPDEEAARTVYASGSGIPFYGRRTTHFLYVVTNTLRGGVGSTGLWDTGALPPGDYVLRIMAADMAGNAVTRELGITLVTGPTENHGR